MHYKGVHIVVTKVGIDSTTSRSGNEATHNQLATNDEGLICAAACLPVRAKPVVALTRHV